jgi:hypothetical protein
LSTTCRRFHVAQHESGLVELLTRRLDTRKCSLVVPARPVPIADLVERVEDPDERLAVLLGAWGGGSQ